MSRIIIFPLILLMISFWACKPDLTAVKTFNEKGEIQAIIEIPAGTNLKLEYSEDQGQIAPDQKNGKDRIVDFLPYPANYGFIPGTLMNAEQGGDGDPLDIFVISEHLASGSVIAVKPIAVLKIKDNGELDTKIVAIPVDESKQVMKAANFSDLMTDYYMAQQILQSWVIGYKGLGKTEFLGWEDEIAATKLVEKWSK